MTTLARIRKKVRRLTATPSTLQLSNDDIDEYINDFYTQDFPAHLKLFSLNTTYDFYTEPNEDRYQLPVNTYTNVKPPAYISGYQSYFSLNREQFFRIYPFTNAESVLGNGNGTAGIYTFTLSNIPVLKREFTVSAEDSAGDTISLIDDGSGNLTLPNDTTVRGTINYTTGALSITDWGNTIPTTSQIIAEYVPYVASRPLGILFFDNYFYLRPVPDKAYKISVEVYRTPAEVLESDSDSPDLHQWWQFIAFGAALKVLEDRQDTETLELLLPRFDEQKQLVLHRTIVQDTPSRTPTIYSEQTGNFFGERPGGWF